MGCVDMEQLLDTAQGRAEPLVADRVHTHLASGCARCQGNWDWIQRIVNVTATDDSVEPPQWVLNRAVRLFESHGPQHKPSVWQRIAASLVFDSLIQPQPVAIRQTTQAARQCLYRAGEWDVDLSFEAGEDPETVNITGQILKGEGLAQEVVGIPVHLIQGGQTVASTAANRLGEFTFDHIAPGAYSLSIQLTDEHLWIEHLEVKLSE